jgi:hypothetical protein
MHHLSQWLVFMTSDDKTATIPVATESSDKSVEVSSPVSSAESPPKEFGGPKGPEPTRFGDWEIKGRCSDF